MGLICTGIEWVLEYNPKPVFQWFVDKVANDRRMADLDPNMEIIGETSKTSGNASYGYCCIDKSKHNSVRFCEQKDLSKYIHDPFFKSMEELFEIVLFAIGHSITGFRYDLLHSSLELLRNH